MRSIKSFFSDKWNWCLDHLSLGWTWSLSHLFVVIPVLLALILIPIAIASFGKDDEGMTEVEKGTETEMASESPTPPSSRTPDGFIVYDMLSGVQMSAGQERTFQVPLGTRVRRYNTEGQVEKVSVPGKKYTLKAKTQTTFDLVWIIEKEFEKRVKPR